MRIGIYLGAMPHTLDGLVDEVGAAEQASLDSAFFGQLTDWDAITAAALVGRQVGRIELGTAVVPTFPRHPFPLAEQALSAQAATDGRFTLGIGPGHQPFMDGTFGVPAGRPVAHTREYLTALRPLLRGEAVEHRGPTLTAVGQIAIPGVTAPPPVLISALGPAMLRTAGELADGTVTVWTRPEGIHEHVAPLVTAAAKEAGRPAPRIAACVLVGVTDDPDGLRETIDSQFAFAATLPNYQANLGRQGISRLSDTAVVGDADAVARELRRYAEAGVTDLFAGILGDPAARGRAREVLAALNADLRPARVS